jgi:hypothetical protein
MLIDRLDNDLLHRQYTSGPFCSYIQQRETLALLYIKLLDGPTALWNRCIISLRYEAHAYIYACRAQDNQLDVMFFTLHLTFISQSCGSLGLYPWLSVPICVGCKRLCMRTGSVIRHFQHSVLLIKPSDPKIVSTWDHTLSYMLHNFKRT